MKIADIITQLKTVLPVYTNYFSDNASVSSLTYAAGTATATSTAHGLQVGHIANIKGAYSPNTITSLTQVNGIATAITAQPHDLTLDWSSIIVAGADQSDYNGTFDMVSAPVLNIKSITRVGSVATITTYLGHGFVVDSNFFIQITGTSRNEYNKKLNVASVVDTTSFTVSVNSANVPDVGAGGTVSFVLNKYAFAYNVSTVAVTPATGTITLNEIRENQYNGRKTVTAVPTVDTFTYAIDTDYAPYNAASGTILVQKGTRISGALNIEKAIDSYTEKSTNELWAFVVPSNTNASKNRQLENDATYIFEPGQNYRQQLINQFNVFVFANTANEISGIDKLDVMQDIRGYLYKSLLGFKLDSGFNEGAKYGITFVNDDVAAYVSAYYIHQFVFEIIYNINANDIINPPHNTAFRRFDISYENIENSDTIKEDTGTL
jgi:hypothetical protein